MKYACCLTLLLLGLTAKLAAEDDLAVKAGAFFQDLKQASPSLYQRLQQNENLMPELLQQMVPGMIPAETRQVTTQHKKAPLYPARLVAKNTVFYARVDRIDEEALQKLLEEMRTTARIANRPVGAILDLRSASQGDFPSVARFVTLFTHNKTGKKHFFQKIPLVILCGSKTNGPAELLTILLERSDLGISMGEAGPGNIFPRKAATLNGKQWLVPEIPDFAKDVPMTAHKPVIECKAYPQIPFEQIGKTSIENDSAVRRAIDLLRSLSAIRNK